jgi:quinone-modifying oxidoreductase subunit QmoC
MEEPMSVEVSEIESPEKIQETMAATVEPPVPEPVRIEPDLAFIRTLMKAGGDSLKKCMQCGTCSAACELAPDLEPFPRKEMAWASWGMKDALFNDPDVWLCHQCNDCSTKCPRGARPGDVLAAVRQEWVIEHAVPRFFARWAHQPQSVLLLLGVMTVLLGAALRLKDPIARVLGMSEELSPEIVISYSSMLPRWMLNLFFLVLGVLAILSMLRGVVYLWKSMKSKVMQQNPDLSRKKLIPSIGAAIKDILVHKKFTQCTEARPRYWSHMLVFFGFLALVLVTLWVITAPYNPLIAGPFIYPLNFWNPFKLLANMAGIALIAGCVLMIKDRMKNSDQTGVSHYTDWSLIGVLLIVVLTGFATEALHFVRLEPHRHLAYFVHLVFAGMLLLYMPYSKFAHIIYRTAAMICAERYNRTKEEQPEPIPAQMESIGEAP